MQSKRKESTPKISTSYTAAHLANVQALLESVWELLTLVIDGRSSCESFARLGQDGYWRKTLPGFLASMAEDYSEEYSQSWPKRGIVSDGNAIRLPMLERRTSGKEFSSWATPNTMDRLPPKSKKALEREATTTRKGRTSPANLRDQASNMHLWPTPKAQNANGTGPSRTGNRADLQTAVMWATPTAIEGSYTGGRPPEKSTKLKMQVYIAEGMWVAPNAADSTGSHGGGQGRSLRTDTHSAKGQLNPDWVEVLMGYEQGWTRLPEGWNENYQKKKRGLESTEESPAGLSKNIAGIDWLDKATTRLLAQRWPAGKGQEQYEWEPPRVAEKIPNRTARIKMLGNSCPPQQYYVMMAAIATMDREAENSNE